MIATFGEILLRLSTQKGVRLSQGQDLSVHVGGAEANVAVSLSKMGHAARILTALPSNPLGQSALAELSSHDVDVNEVKIRDGRMGLYFLETGSGVRSSQVTYDRAESAFSKMTADEIDWDKAFQGVTWLHWSGISPGVSESALALTQAVITKASERPEITISVDLNYRAKLWNYGVDPADVMPDLVKHCHVLVGNEGHNKIMLSIPPVMSGNQTAMEDLPEAMSRVRSAFPKLQTVAISMRDNVSASRNKLKAAIQYKSDYAYSKTYDIDHIEDRIGGGDAFMAGLIHGLIDDTKNTQSVIEFAVAASVLKHTIKGDFNLVSAQEVEQFIQNNGNANVTR